MKRNSLKTILTTAAITAAVLGGSTRTYAEELPTEVGTEATVEETAEVETEMLSEDPAAAEKIEAETVEVMQEETEASVEMTAESAPEEAIEITEETENAAPEGTEGGRTVPYYNLLVNGGNWDGSHYYTAEGTLATDVFFFDGTYTYYLMNDGTPMTDRLTYHPDGEHIIYLDTNGHEVFVNFQYCPSVGYTCYFDSQGYLYKDQITFVGDKTYYLNANGAMEQSGWFRFANGVDYGFANSDGTLMDDGWGYDPYGRVVFYHWNGMVARGLIADSTYYYSMDTTDGHYLGQFSKESWLRTKTDGSGNPISPAALHGLMEVGSFSWW